MPENGMPGPVCDLSSVREAVCIHTHKIFDSCRDKDCVEDLRFYPTASAQEVLSACQMVRGGTAELLYVYTDVEPVTFNRGFYSIDMRFFYRVPLQVGTGTPRCTEAEGLCVFDKRVILFGSEGSAKIFSSDTVLDDLDIPGCRRSNLPTAVVEAVAKLVAEAGGQAVIADSPGGPFTAGLLRGLYESTGMQAAARRAGAELNFSTESADVEVPNPCRTHMLTVLRCAAEADAIVSVGKIKTHGLTAYTGAVKNLFGLVPGMLKIDYHARFPDIDDFCGALLDIAGWAKPCLSVLDGIVGMEGKGPSGGTPRRIGALVVSDDPHAADVVGAALIGLAVEEVPTLRLAREKGLLPVPLVLGESVEDLAVPDFHRAPVEITRRGILTD